MERHLGILAESKLNMSQQCALGPNQTLGCLRPSTATGREEGLSSLCCAVLCGLTSSTGCRFGCHGVRGA